jgi:hypothetical protein
MTDHRNKPFVRESGPALFVMVLGCSAITFAAGIALWVLK